MKRQILAIFFIIIIVVISLSAWSQQITGTVRDSLGAVVPKANVELLEGSGKAVPATTDDLGRYQFAIDHAARYQVRAKAPRFTAATSDQHYAAPNRSTNVDLTLFPSAVKQEIVVTATGSPLPETQTGSSITLLDATRLDQKQEVQDALRSVSGAQMAQTGMLGNISYLFVRGGSFDDNKVLIDGIPLNDIGGSVDFGNLGASAIEKVEVQRGPNSALFGADAMASVVDIQTRRGTTLTPEFNYSAEGGNFGTYRQAANLGGAWRKFDYFSDFTRFDTDNSEPNSTFHNETYSGNFGWNLLPNTDVRVTVRRSVSALGSAGAVGLYGIPDDANVRNADLLVGATINSQTTQRWHNLLRYGATRSNYSDNEPAPTGISATDSYGDPIYLGAPVTLTGANGYSASGQAFLSSVATYTASSLTNRDFVYAQSDYTLNSHVAFLGGFRYEDERGYTAYTGNPNNGTERGNYSYLMQLQGGFWDRAYYSIGSSIEKNAVFGVAGTPRASLAYYLLRPTSNKLLSGTRLKFNFGKGFKEPSIYYENTSLYYLLQQQPNGQALIQQYGIKPVGPQLSRSFDGGVEQQLLGGHARIGVTFFHNQFDNELEGVPSQFLQQLGIPPALTAQSGLYSASVNTLAYRAQGVEAEAEYHWRQLAVRGGWTYLDAVVQHSFASSAAEPAVNPLFPNVPIGAYSPLVGARPFLRAPHTGYVGIDWSQPRWTVSVSGIFVGSRDDSTYAVDSNYGNTLLLPNHNLLAPYQRVDLTASYRMSSKLSLVAGAQNLLSQHYQESFGYPSLPFTFQSGIRLTLGGESWSRK
jgi:iron complex outermembrane receptor protein/vitamin B12 transporter